MIKKTQLVLLNIKQIIFQEFHIGYIDTAHKEKLKT